MRRLPRPWRRRARAAAPLPTLAASLRLFFLPAACKPCRPKPRFSEDPGTGGGRSEDADAVLAAVPPETVERGAVRVDFDAHAVPLPLLQGVGEGRGREGVEMGV